MTKKHSHNYNHRHNPFEHLDEETQMKIQELQMLEQAFQQLLMQKNAFAIESNETDLIIKEVEKTNSEVSKIVGGQIIIRSSKEEILKYIKKKKELIETRTKSIDEQEKEFSNKIENIREEIMKKIQG